MNKPLQIMQHAVNEASLCIKRNEVPVGAVVVDASGKVIASAGNEVLKQHDITAHAEILAIRAACKNTTNYRLPGTTAYLTLEPCAMCAGALIHARVERVVIATAEPRAGAAGSVLNILQNDKFNHRCDVEYGLFQKDSADMLRSFFRLKRS